VCDYPELVGDATLTILDASGKLIGYQSITLNEGINLFLVNQELTPGIYFLNISNSSKSTPVLRHAVR
ncbi:MAG: T9SS type A sorting domain-containing protein, partial [Bacteroidota bacterium]